MKTFVISLILFCCSASYLTAQNSYIVTTAPAQEVKLSEEEEFIRSNFQLHKLCDWAPGTTFMFMPSSRDMLIPILSFYDTEKDVNSSTIKQKIFTFIGTEEKSQELSIGTNHSTRFLFECEGKKYYHELKNTQLNEICEKNPRACIKGFAYLKDVDLAKELLVGRKVYIQSESARIDDPNNYTGYRQIIVPTNTEAIITAVGVGSQSFPVKIVFTDTQGNSFYLDLALSRTNSGMDMDNFQAENKMKYFSNAISFTNKKLGKIELMKDRYIGLSVYPKKNLSAKREISSDGKRSEGQINLPRYTILTLKDMQVPTTSTLAVLHLVDKLGNTYTVEADLKYDIITRNNNYIEDLFGFGDLHHKYPGLSEARWKMISRGELEVGMNGDECRLSVGNPTAIQMKKDIRFEIWFYNGKTLEFENGTLKRF